MSAIDSMIATATSRADTAATGRQQDILERAKGMDRGQVKQAAQDFEAFFLGQMLQPMFNTVKTSDMFGGGPGEDMWKGMMVDQYAKEIAQKGGLGIADQVMAVMIQAQEAQK